MVARAELCSLKPKTRGTYCSGGREGRTDGYVMSSRCGKVVPKNAPSTFPCIKRSLVSKCRGHNAVLSNQLYAGNVKRSSGQQRSYRTAPDATSRLSLTPAVSVRAFPSVSDQQTVSSVKISICAMMRDVTPGTLSAGSRCPGTLGRRF